MIRWIVLALAMGCNPTSVGRPCVDPKQHDTSVGTQIVAPALECPSRLCLVTPVDLGPGRAMCTGACETDDDCAAEATAACPGGFVCAVPVAVGQFCCKKLCVCGADVDPAAPRMPAACDPDKEPTAAARCRNVVAP